MQIQDRPFESLAPLFGSTTESSNLRSDRFQTGASAGAEVFFSSDLSSQNYCEQALACGNQAFQVDLSYPPDRISEASQVLEILEAMGYRITVDQADWLPDGSKAVMIWWKLGAQRRAKIVFESLRTLKSAAVKLAAEPSNSQMIGDIQIALGRDS